MTYHPHVHFVVPGGGVVLNGDGQPIGWKTTADDFLVHHGTLIKKFRRRLKRKLDAAGITDDVPRTELAAAWKKKSVVDIKPVGDGRSVLKYLAPYVTGRVARGSGVFFEWQKEGQAMTLSVTSHG